MSQDAAALEGRLRSIEGPTAFTGDWRRFWDMLIITSVSSFRRNYVDTTFGFVWMFLGPLIGFGVLYVFITVVVRRFIGVVPNYGELLLLNITLFNVFRNGTGSAMRSLVGSAGLLKKVPVPRIVMPMSAIAEALYVTLANLVVVFAWILISGIPPMWTWLLLPVLLLGMLVFTTAMGLALAALYSRWRDIGQIWRTVSRILFYVSPVIFPFPLIRRTILWEGQIFNPIAPILAEARKWIITPSSPGWFEVRGYGFASFLPFIILAVLCVLGVWLFAREAPRAAETL